MVETIGPMVRAGRARGIRGAHLVGGLVGGVIAGAAAGTLGWLLRDTVGGESWLVAAWVLGALALVALLRDLRATSRFGAARQTPRSWRYVLPARLAAFLNGADLGLGWSTRIYFASFIVGAGAALYSASVATGALIGAAFGLARAATVLVVDGRVGPGSEVVDRMLAARRPMVLINAAGLLQFIVLLGMVRLV